MTCQQLPPQGPATPANVMRELWNKCADRMTTEELKWFSRASETAMLQLSNLQETTVGLACLVSDDTKENKRIVAGNFQSPHDVSVLLFSIAESIESARGLLEVSSEADLRLSHPELYRVKD